MRKVFLIFIVFFISSCTARMMNIQNSINLADSNLVKIMKSEPKRSCVTWILNMIPLGSNYIGDIIKKSNYKKVTMVEKEFSHYILFSKDCTLLYGE